MSEIIEPSQDLNKDPSTAAWEKQVTETTNNLQYQLDNINESVTESTPKIAVYSLDSTGANQQFEPLAGGEGFVCYIDYTDDLPTLPVSGLVFTAFSESQVNTTIYQYRRTGSFGTFPPHPGNVTYNAGNSAGAWTATTDWQKTIPSDDGSTPIFRVEAKIAVTGSNAVIVRWSNPEYLNTVETGEGFVYFTTEQANAPSTPSATDYNYVTGQMTGLTNGWQEEPVSINITDTTKKHWQSHFKAETAAGRNVATVTFQSPTGYIAVGANLQSDNFDGNLADLSSPGTAGWGIARSSGNAIFNNVAVRGKLNASDIDAGSLHADRIASTTINADNITAGDLNADRLSGGTIEGVTLNITGLTSLEGAVQAPNLAVGVIMQTMTGSGSAPNSGAAGSVTFGSGGFTSSNLHDADGNDILTDLVVIAIAEADGWTDNNNQDAHGTTVTGVLQTGGSTAFNNIVSATGSPYVSLPDLSVVTTKIGPLAQNTAYTMGLTYAQPSNASHWGNGSVNMTMMEVRRPD